MTGVYSDGRSISEVEIQLPLQVTSTEQAAAFITSGIENQISRNFTPLISTDWIELGKNNFNLLPWVVDQKRYNERPKCLVERDWLKLAIRDLQLLTKELKDDELFSITFKNGIFSIRTFSKVIAFPAIGEDWKVDYKIESKDFKRFPKRLGQKEIEISIWGNQIRIGNWCYPIKIYRDSQPDAD